jgi:acyl carrier protein
MSVPAMKWEKVSKVDTYVEQIQALIVEELHIPIESATADLFRTGLLDSMGLIQLISHIEEHFGFRLPVDQLDLDSFRSVLQIAQLVAHAQESSMHNEGAQSR